MPNDNGYNDYTTGDQPTGEDFDHYIGEQVISLFDDSTDRDTQLPFPKADGQRAYDRDTGIEWVAMLDPAEDGTLAGHWTWQQYGRAKAWTEYTPTLTATTTDPTLGSGSTAVGRWVREGTLATVVVYVELGATSAAGSGIYEVSLPTECPASPSWYGAQEFVAGNGISRDSSTGERHNSAVVIVGSDTVRLEADSLTTYVDDSNLVAWADGDVVLSATITYETEEVY